MIGYLEKLGGCKIDDELAVYVVETIFGSGIGLTSTAANKAIQEILNNKEKINGRDYYHSTKRMNVSGREVIRGAYGGTARYVI